MDFPSPLMAGTLIQRYKRFLTDIRLDSGEEITAHCANSGSLFALKTPGSRVWVSKVPDHVERKLRYDWQLIEDRGALVCINTSLPNKIVAEALQAQKIPELAPYTSLRPEVKYGTNSRIDFLLEGSGLPPMYVEVKSVNHREGQHGLFPDAVTERGFKQLDQMIGLLDQGAKACVLYVVVRGDCQGVTYAHHIDPAYGRQAERAHLAGINFFAYDCKITPKSITLDRKLVVEPQV